MQEHKLEASELQDVYEQLTQREARLRVSEAKAAAEADAAAADVGARHEAAIAKLRTAEELHAKTQKDQTLLKDAR